MKKRRNIEIFSMSFLDVISCGFGAIILLLVLSLALEPATLEHITADLTGEVEKQEEESKRIAAASKEALQRLSQSTNNLRAAEIQVAALRDQLKTSEGTETAMELASELKQKAELEAVLQKLTEEMKRLLEQQKPPEPDQEAVIGGIPVDSEYVIFVIDTSGSMLKAAWPSVLAKIEEVLEAYPKIKGIQVLNDMGHYMFREYAGKWITDTPARRRAIIKRLAGWRSYSNSSPVEGINHAVRVYFRKDARISLYVFGDDFSGASFEAVLSDVKRINKQRDTGETRVRIHTFGFPVLLQFPELGARATRFSHLMRLLAEQNSGSFVGLNQLK